MIIRVPIRFAHLSGLLCGLLLASGVLGQDRLVSRLQREISLGESIVISDPSLARRRAIEPKDAHLAVNRKGAGVGTDSALLTSGVIHSSSQLTRLLRYDFTAHVDATFGLFGSSFDYSFAEEERALTEESTVIWYLKVYLDYGWYELNNWECSKDAQKEDIRNSPDRFWKRFGDGIVAEERRAIELNVVFQADNLNEELKRRLTEQWSAAVGGPFGDIDVAKKRKDVMRRITDKTTVRYRIQTIGGNGLRFAPGVISNLEDYAALRATIADYFGTLGEQHAVGVEFHLAPLDLYCDMDYIDVLTPDQLVLEDYLSKFHVYSRGHRELVDLLNNTYKYPYLSEFQRTYYSKLEALYFDDRNDLIDSYRRARRAAQHYPGNLESDAPKLKRYPKSAPKFGVPKPRIVFHSTSLIPNLHLQNFGCKVGYVEGGEFELIWKKGTNEGRIHLSKDLKSLVLADEVKKAIDASFQYLYSFRNPQERKKNEALETEYWQAIADQKYLPDDAGRVEKEESWRERRYFLLLAGVTVFSNQYVLELRDSSDRVHVSRNIP